MALTKSFETTSGVTGDYWRVPPDSVRIEGSGGDLILTGVVALYLSMEARATKSWIITQEHVVACEKELFEEATDPVNLFYMVLKQKVPFFSDAEDT